MLSVVCYTSEIIWEIFGWIDKICIIKVIVPGMSLKIIAVLKGCGYATDHRTGIDSELYCGTIKLY